MIYISFMLAFALFLAATPSAAQTVPCETCPEITCGETKRIASEARHTLQAVYRYHATAGDVVSFESRTVVGTNLGLELSVLGATAGPQPDDEVWICAWQAPATDEYLVLLYGASISQWDVALTMHCGPPPEGCMVPVVSTSWTLLKSLFR